MGHVEEVGASSHPPISAKCHACLAPPPLPPKPVAQTTTRPMQPSSRLWQLVSPSCPLPAVDVSSFLLQHHRRTWNWPPTKNSTLLSRIPQTFHGVSFSGSTHPEEADATTSVGLTLVPTSFVLVPDSQLTIAIDRGQATTVLSEHHTKDQRKRTPLHYHVCRVSALCPARNSSFTLEPNDGLCVGRCHCATSNVQCASMACGWCVAQTLLLTRAAKTTSTWRLSALPTAQEVSDQHFENSSYSPFDQQLAKRLAKQPDSSPSFGSLYELETIWTENDHKSN